MIKAHLKLKNDEYLTVTVQMTPSGQAVNEKEWRRMNLEWERRRRDAKEEEEKRKCREAEDRKHRMELRQKSKQEETDRRKVEERRRRERENLAGLREALGSLRNNEKLDVQVKSGISYCDR